MAPLGNRLRRGVIMDLLSISLMGLFVGIVGTGLGGLLGVFYTNPSKRFLSLAIATSGGLMLSIVCFDLLPEAFDISGLNYTLIGVAIGVIIVMVMEQIMQSKGEGKDFEYLRTGFLMGAAIALHNLPEGLAIGSSFMASQSVGLGMALVIGLHDFPEGLSMAAPLMAGGMKGFDVLYYTVLSGIPTGIGAFIGAYMGELSPNLIALNMGMAGGCMLYITCGEMFPMARDLHKGRLTAVGILFGIVLGILITEML